VLLGRFLHVFVLAFVAIILEFIVHYPLEALARVMPRIVAAGLTFLLLLGVVVAFIVLGVPIIEEQGAKLLEKLPAAIDQIHSWWRRVERTEAMGALGAEVPGGLRGRIREEMGALSSQIVPLAMGVVTLVATVLLVMVLAMFLAYSPRSYTRGIVRLIPRSHARDVVILLRRLGDTMQAWTLATLIAMLTVGTLIAIGMYAIGLEGWLVLGLLGFVGEFVPYVGPTAAAVPAVLVAFADSPRTGLYAIGIYLVVQTLESHLLQPILMKRAVHIQPALLLVWQLAMASAFGIVGLLIATPLLAILQEIVDYAYVHKTLGKPARHVARRRR
jgi:predicted PurR-regulated permease PerM